MPDFFLSRLACAGLLLYGVHAQAEQITVAVASNFAATLEHIGVVFEAETGHKVRLSSGSTGKHYAQIVNGAPYDAFFAADVERPKQLEEDGLIVPNSRFTYARGRLVLWSKDKKLVDKQGAVLATDSYRRLAIANPRLAPYGRAALQVLEVTALWERLATRIVRGENVSQTYQFVKSGNAELGFVAYSQIIRDGKLVEGSWWAVPQELYDPIEQQAVIMKDSAAVRNLVAFMRSERGRYIISEHGYGLP